MNILHIKYAVQVVKGGLLNKAAESRYVMLTDISRSIKELEWTVSYRSDEGYLRLVCTSVIDERAFNERRGTSLWKDSSLRSRLNSEFYNTAFDDF